MCERPRDFIDRTPGVADMHSKLTFHAWIATALTILFSVRAFTANDKRGIPVGEKFIGSPVAAKPLSPKHVYKPEVFIAFVSPGGLRHPLPGSLSGASE
ncbi:hypothetical protein N7491_006012 [Penicillium cf. griseofulvum]|uniref:Uncharacterized protein n=1 Tax=Penicillium cf. griseofulvum TaxID=2972120 RepID=A0A9W9IY81_9EURO|nr:hypothetical protein N7472_010957 [Penicillium cf. griseofulvum]KAJ5428996.1 hypothetical protein N7491_006012 [Penicillium cf. griseofulvum]KAJ5437217.1 hypothetical protein N7445_008102 [Penicillium cf. griseofulvum]